MASVIHPLMLVLSAITAPFQYISLQQLPSIIKWRKREQEIGGCNWDIRHLSYIYEWP